MEILEVLQAAKILSMQQVALKSELNALTDLYIKHLVFQPISIAEYWRKRERVLLRSLSLVKHQLSFIAMADLRAKSRPAFQKRAAMDDVFYALWVM